ncbi:hypothetical protein [Streptomyces sp. JJ36]|uniref:hypothetical protein n=1 Tax=Streptomyces sp. JJ36 TaxID=2736645 RepID=UPI001F1FAFE5|nr:hypothetical protein [Streptomyces sp. JJ36]MCF6523636.1 hypothetical protein [Streptomyces sp. JJ36]
MGTTARSWAPPPGPDSQMQPAGVHWDAVKAPAHLGRPALEALGCDSGAVIRDPYRGELYWLLCVGAAASWPRLPDIDTYGPACWIEVPPEGREGGPGPYWLPLVGGGRLYTDPVRLHAALATVITDRYPPDAAARL